jgi:hypothetical protein
MPRKPPRGQPRSTFRALVDWCFGHMPPDTVASRPIGGRAGDAVTDQTDTVPSRQGAALAGSDLPRCFFGGSLLFRRMEMLNIDRTELAKDDPLLLYELRGLCTLCRSTKDCAQDCGREPDAVRWDLWHAYCPNAKTLMTLGALQNCGLAASHLTTPATTGFLQRP